MNFPDNMFGFRRSLINEDISDKMLEVLMINGETEEIDDNLISWTVTKFSAS